VHLHQRFSQIEHKIYDGADHDFFCFGVKSIELNDDIAQFFAKH